MGSELPDGARVPEGQDWCGMTHHEELPEGPFFMLMDGSGADAYCWCEMKPSQKAYAAARCWAWWSEEVDRRIKDRDKSTTVQRAERMRLRKHVDEALRQVEIWREVWRGMES